jgi:hypothetical protein
MVDANISSAKRFTAVCVTAWEGVAVASATSRGWEDVTVPR